MINILFIVGIILFVLFICQLCSSVGDKPVNSKHNSLDICLSLKRCWAKYCITANKKRKNDLHNSEQNVLEYSEIMHDNNNNSVLFYGADQKDNSLLVIFSHKESNRAEISLHLNTADGETYVLPGYPDTTASKGLNQTWTAAGLKIEFLVPQQRWRIAYNGMLRNLTRGDDPSDDNIEHVRLNFIFIANTHSIRWPEDWSSTLHADALAREPWKTNEWANKIKLFDYTGFDQIGSLLGQVTYKDGSTSSLYLRGIHQSRWGEHEFQESVILFGVMRYGDIYYLGEGSTMQSFPRIQFGQFRHSREQMDEIEKMDLSLSDFRGGKFRANSTYKTSFTAAGKDYNVLAKINSIATLYHGQPWNRSNKIATVKLEVNGKTGTGLIHLWSPYDGPFQAKPSTQIRLLKESSMSVDKNDYVLYFDDAKCQNESVVGGKGYSLAVLSSTEDTEVQFIVPKGFCVTVFAFESQLRANKKIQQVIDDIKAISVGKMDGNLQQCCDEAVYTIRSTPLNDNVKAAILRAIEKLESEDGKHARYAVRSSAMGEDSEETSAAGQNSTYLGVQGADKIVESVAMCWASLFSYQSVKYRKQHGISIRSSMGVCVQKMVNPDAAGVMFTRHPTTGDPSNIIITANYGLGETVVSASVEPDTIVVRKSWDNKLSIKSSTAGSKREKIVTSGEGVVTIELNDQEKETICLPDKIALQLADIGIKLETLFGGGRDIEWAVVGEKIYLLQARPITTLYTWTEFELMHELDSGVPSDIDITTFANIGEVLPNPVSPLSLSVSNKAFSILLNRVIATKDQVFFNVINMKNTINYYNTFLRMPPKEITLLNKVIDIAICGKVLVTPEILRTAQERNGMASFIQRNSVILQMFKELIQFKTPDKIAMEVCKNFRIKGEDFDSARSLYDEINRKFDEYLIVVDCHMLASRVSITYQIVAMKLLTNGYTDLIPEHFTDIALLLSSCNDIVGTKVLKNLQKIVTILKQSKMNKAFQKIKPTEGIEWLTANCPSAAKELDDFLEEHGHRCIQEMDFISEPWSLRPENLISTLQVVLASPEMSDSSAKETLDVKEVVASLKTPKSSVSKWILTKITPLCRKAVGCREMTKSCLVKVVHTVRLAYRRLAKLMVLEEYLPSEDLIFFLTHEEIGQILNDGDTVLVQKAYRRKRLFPKLREFKYSEFNTGMPIPVEISFNVPTNAESVKIEAMSACGGKVLGRACVMIDVSEANSIQQDDILITHATDIAWSPYFPLLSGIVTELGGLISHGAVIAREYGLPCIIGAKCATRFFQTGDVVLLDADAGTLHLVKRHE